MFKWPSGSIIADKICLCEHLCDCTVSEYGRHQKDEVGGYLHSEGHPDDHTQGSVQHKGPIWGKSGKNQGGCWKIAGNKMSILVCLYYLGSWIIWEMRITFIAYVSLNNRMLASRLPLSTVQRESMCSTSPLGARTLSRDLLYLSL